MTFDCDHASQWTIGGDDDDIEKEIRKVVWI